MKNFFSFLFVVAIVAITLSSCQTKTVDTKTVVKTTVKEIGTEGFLIKKVVKGDTVWGYSEEVYGTGVEWREIVAENPFLNQPGRVYYDQGREKWIVILFPGESIRIRGQVVTPTFSSEETTVTTTTETAGIPWWGWLLIAVGGIIFIFFLLGILGLLSYQRQYKPRLIFLCEERQEPVVITPTINYTATGGDRSAYIEGAKETTILHSSSGEVKITVR